MEGDHASSPEPPERAISGTGARSYDCIFCKRGFSNAQALGGHMNIHRKDKAKLKQPPVPYDDDRTISSSSSVTIKDSTVVSSYSLSTRNFSTSRLGHGNHIGASTLPFTWPWIVAPREQDIQEEVGRGGEDNETCTQHSNNRRQGGEAAEAMELDLELRLGPEPPRASMTSLKEFL